MAGESAKAKSAYNDFLTLWKDGDPDIPILNRLTNCMISKHSDGNRQGRKPMHYPSPRSGSSGVRVPYGMFLIFDPNLFPSPQS
jgi:hypothetical protein